MANSTKITLKIKPFKNPSGNIVFRVTGSICGERVQKNFPTRQAAETFMNGLIAAADQGESSRSRVSTTIFPEDAELREAEVVWQRLRQKIPHGSLITAVDYYLAHAGELIKDGVALEIVDQFCARRRDRGNKENTIAVGRTILRKFLTEAGISRISDFTPDRATYFVFDAKVGMRTRRDRLDQLNNWAEYLVKEKFLARNFVADIDRPVVTYDGVITTLKTGQVLALLKAAAEEPVGKAKTRGAMLPYFAICALSGVRPDEAKRLGPDWAWFSKENCVITGFRAKTTQKSRTVEVHPELVEILEHCQNQGFAPSQFSVKAFNRIRERAGVFDLWDNDILRHTYASHHYVWKRDMSWLEKNMGNSADVLKRSYLNQTTLAGAGKKYFDIALRDILPEQKLNNPTP